MITRTTKSGLGDGSHLFTVVYESEPCDVATVEGRQQQIDLLRTVASTPELQRTGNVYFNKMKMIHDGNRWVITLEGVSA